MAFTCKAKFFEFYHQAKIWDSAKKVAPGPFKVWLAALISLFTVRHRLVKILKHFLASTKFYLQSVSDINRRRFWTVQSVSISPTFYEQLFFTTVIFTALLYFLWKLLGREMGKLTTIVDIFLYCFEANL